MKSFLPVLGLSLLFFIAGCSQTPAPQVAAPGEPAAEVTPPPPDGVLLVKLKLPSMVCGGCAQEVKDTLVKVDGVSHIATDPTKHECTFWFAKSDAEIKAKLDDLAKTNEKIEGYERLN
jgi:copper chaperone CopZ